jgi:hypothetical protein
MAATYIEEIVVVCFSVESPQIGGAAAASRLALA